jgi:EAL domain-containing protein (putative c-di-GMP-specific phosphodiesterase class I)
LLERVGAAGFRLVIDDFGTGYSNLAYLKRFFITKLKIDQSFVRDIPADADDAMIVRGIIGLASSLGLRVVAEGVEYPAQLDFLMAAGCNEAQGYLLARPMSARQFAERF